MYNLEKKIIKYIFLKRFYTHTHTIYYYPSLVLAPAAALMGVINKDKA